MTVAATPDQQQTSDAAFAAATSGTGLRVLLFVAGFIIIPTLAEAQPELVNGFLLLLLAGIILTNYENWLPYLTGITPKKG